MKLSGYLAVLLLFSHINSVNGQITETIKWKKTEVSFVSSVSYENPVQDLRSFKVTFQSPSGRQKTINGFWDGGDIWKARFMPDEEGIWTFETICSDPGNTGLVEQKGEFLCKSEQDNRDIFRLGPVIRQKGYYHLAHADGSPFFYLACTAWNGALKSTDGEWDQYLEHRAKNNYSVIQLVTTQWRGCDMNSLGQVAFEGCGRIKINPEFFRLLDKKIDRVNDFGLVAAPVILWALQGGTGRELSPGYYLPDDQAILLARYIVARYGGNHVIWFLGGDGNYTGTYEQRWKTIGRAVFDGTHQGIVAQHPQGTSWIGNIYSDEEWLDIIGYQSSHSNEKGTVEWITRGPVSKEWPMLPARPLINLEPNYEEIHMKITDRDVRNASWWSLFTAPLAGISYGANGIWPWLRPGEKILNHSDGPGTSPWYESINFPGSIQMGYMASFIKEFNWWDLRPAPELLLEQPGDSLYNLFVSVVKSHDNRIILAYFPARLQAGFRKPFDDEYTVRWFNPANNEYAEGRAEERNGIIYLTPPGDSDFICILEYKGS